MEKHETANWAVRDVLVGTVRSPRQLEACRKHRFYYIPAEQLGDAAFSVRWAALYQSPFLFGPQAGIRYYGEVAKCSAVRRGDITEVPARRGTEQALYYRFEIREWRQLKQPIAAQETAFVKGFTSLFLLEHSTETPQLWLRSEEEYRLYVSLKDAADVTFRGFAVSVRDGKILLSDKGRVFAEYAAADFAQTPGPMFQSICRACLRRDAMNEISEI